MPLSVWQLDPANLTPYYNLALCSALAQAGCDIHYATSIFSYDPALLYPTNFQTHFLYFPKSNRLRSIYTPFVWRGLKTLLYPFGHRRFLSALDVKPPAIVHIQWTRLPRLDLWLIDQLHQRSIPVVYTAHDVEPLFSLAFDLSSIYEAVDAIIVHTDANRIALLQRYPSLAEKVIRVIPHLATEWAIPVGADRANARSLLDIPANAPVLLFFGSNRSYKGLSILVDTFARAREIRPDLWLLVAGRLTDPYALVSLRHPQIRVEPEYIPADRVWLYHLAADVAVLPYTEISQSGELITAMNFGLPVIVTDVGGMTETVHKNGWVVPVNDPTSLTEAIVDAFSDVLRLESLGAQSLRLSREFHSPAHVAEQTITLYSEVIQCYNASSTVPTV